MADVGGGKKGIFLSEVRTNPLKRNLVGWEVNGARWR